MEENNRKNHPNFTEYQEFIVTHANYKGLTFVRNKDSSIRWVETDAKSPTKIARTLWWDSKCSELGIDIMAGAYAKAAKKNHPTELEGKKPCKICGKYLKFDYVYPNSNTLKKINQTGAFGICPPFQAIVTVLVVFRG